MVAKYVYFFANDYENLKVYTYLLKCLLLLLDAYSIL